MIDCLCSTMPERCQDKSPQAYPGKKTWLKRKPIVSITGTTRQHRNQPCNCGSGKKFKHCHGASNVIVDECGRVMPIIVADATFSIDHSNDKPIDGDKRVTASSVGIDPCV